MSKNNCGKFTYGGIYCGRIYRSPLKHLGSLSIKYLTNMYNTAPNVNTILHLGKGDPTISILKPNKDHNIGTSYRSISLLSPIAKALEKVYYFFIYLFSFLLTINLKLIIVHVETKIVNKEAATKRSTLLHAQRQLSIPLNKAM